MPERFRDLLFPRMATEVQVTLGSELFGAFDAAWTRSRREYRQVTSGIRKNIYSTAGVNPPEIASPKADRELASRQFSILLPGRARKRVVGAVPADVQPDRLTSVVAPLLQKEMQSNVAPFIKAEVVAAALDELPDELATWLQQQYSLTDLKLLLRDFVGAPKHDERAQTPERTLTQLPWLLGSLAFWSSVCAPREQACLVDGLAAAQRARISAAVRPAAPSSVATSKSGVRAGIDALLDGQMAKAAASFKSAGTTNRTAAASEFTTEWAQLARSIQGYQLTRTLTTGIAPACQEPKAEPDSNRTVTLRAAWEIEDYLDRRQPGGGDEENRLTLGLCLLRSHIANEDGEGAEAAWQRLTRDTPDFGAWPLPAQFLAGRVLFDAVRLEIIDDKHLTDSQRLLGAALAKSSETDRSDTIYGLVEICRNIWHSPQCLEHVRAIEAGVPGSFELPFQLGVALAGMASNRTDAEAALGLVAKAESLVPSSGSKDDHDRLRAWILYARASATSELSRDQPTQVAASRDLYRKLLDGLSLRRRDGWPARADAYFGLVLLNVFEGHPEDARRILDVWRKEEPGTALFDTARVFIMIEGGDDNGLKDYARGVAKAPNSETYTLFMASLAAILANSLDASNEAMVRRYLNSDHESRDAVRLLLSWRYSAQGQSEAAKALIDWRWSRVDPASWKRRLDRGDLDAWREMLIAYFHGSLPKSQIFEGLADEAQYRAAPMGRTNQPYSTTLSEAHFYDSLFEGSQGDGATRKARMKRALEQVVAIRDVRIWEYYLARYLLRSLGS